MYATRPRPRAGASHPALAGAMEVDPRLLWKDGAYNDHSIHDEWKHVATKYNDAVGVEVCRIVRLRDYKDDVRVGVGVECILCGPNKHYTAQFDENGHGSVQRRSEDGRRKERLGEPRHAHADHRLVRPRPLPE